MAKRKKRYKKRGENPLIIVGRTIADHKSIYIILGVLLAFLIIGAVAIKYIADNYTITNIYVTGNTHYTNDEIIDMVITVRLSHNSMHLSMKYRDKSI